MFEQKRCRRCGKGLKKDWVACPFCGERTEYKKPYRNIFENIDEEFERIDKMFGPIFVRFPKFDTESPFKGGGINIVIKSGAGMRPKIDVRTSGNYKKLEPQIKRRLGITGEVEEVREEKRKVRVPKITEEPETKVEKVGNEETIMIKLPDVKNLEDIEIRRLEQSLEIKAFAGDKAYFKLIPIKSNVQISDRSFNNGILKIKVSR
jgi:HSP20 family molecular chaperone IbpA